MSKMPSFKAREVLEILFKSGFKKIRTTGSHIRLIKGDRFVTVPFHSKGNIPKGTLESIIKQSKLPKELLRKKGKSK